MILEALELLSAEKNLWMEVEAQAMRARSRSRSRTCSCSHSRVLMGASILPFAQRLVLNFLSLQKDCITFQRKTKSIMRANVHTTGFR